MRAKGSDSVKANCSFAQLINKSFLLKDSLSRAVVVKHRIDYNSVDFEKFFMFVTQIFHINNNGGEIGLLANKSDVGYMLLECLNSVLDKLNLSRNGNYTPVINDEVIRAVVNDFIDVIVAGPCEFFIYFPLPNLSVYPAMVHLSEKIRIEVPEAGLLSCFKAVTQQVHLVDTIPFLVIRESGYVATGHDSPLIVRSASSFKQLLMLAEMFGLVVRKQFSGHDYYREINKKTTCCFVVGATGFHGCFQVPFMFSYALSTFFVTKSCEAIINAVASGSIASSGIFMPIRRGLDGEGKGYERIRSSLEWLFESYFAENIAASFVFASLSAEAIVSDDRDVKTSGEIIASRLAYATHKTYNARKEFAEKFKKFYLKRSDIVHGKNNTIRSDDLLRLEEIRNAVKRLIKTELLDSVD